jgi:hypothetical protein
VRIYLSDADRERYGAPEFLPFKASFGLREAAAMKVATKWSVELLLDAWQKRPALDMRGEVITRPVLDEAGQPVLDEAGVPRVEPVMEGNPEAMAVLVWLALRRAGIRVPFDDDFDIDTQVRVVPDEDDELEAGKAPETTTTS